MKPTHELILNTDTEGNIINYGFNTSPLILQRHDVYWAAQVLKDWKRARQIKDYETADMIKNAGVYCIADELKDDWRWLKVSEGQTFLPWAEDVLYSLENDKHYGEVIKYNSVNLHSLKRALTYRKETVTEWPEFRVKWGIPN